MPARYRIDRSTDLPVEIGLLPSGYLHCFPWATGSDSDGNAGNARIGKAFSRHTGEGLFALRQEWKNVRKQCAGRIGSMLELLQGRFSKHFREIVTDCETA